FWVSAWQSAVFNRLLDERLQDGTVATLALGDVAWKHGNGSRFQVDQAAVDAAGDEALAARAQRFEISPTGVLPGSEALAAHGPTLEREHAAIRAFGMDPAFFETANPWQQGTRRPFRVRVSNAEIEGASDEHGPYVRVAFDLPAGAYATVVLRELGVEVAD
ncbi:MAG: tRNA pseudouridine(13) synthase TruD, partial [Phycisphaerae bacterium]|nr:tRNA pseudouridine(13) synthase TruD [Phycisphaerae bacterium]